MAVQTHNIEVQSRGDSELVDLTDRLASTISGCGLKAGTVTLFVTGSTASLSTIEFEPGAVRDVGLALERLAPAAGHYFHHATWGDDNGNAHVRACLMGPSLVVPFAEGRPLLGTWQQVVLLDFDTRPRQRRIVAQVLGE